MKIIYSVLLSLLFSPLILAENCEFQLTKSGKESDKSKEAITSIIVNSCTVGEPLVMSKGSSRGHIAIIRKYCDIDKPVIPLGYGNYGSLGFMCTYNGNKDPLVEEDFSPKKWDWR